MQETQETWVRSLGGENPLGEEMETRSSILAGTFHGQRSLVGYSPRGHKESDTTEHTVIQPQCMKESPRELEMAETLPSDSLSQAFIRSSPGDSGGGGL